MTLNCLYPCIADVLSGIEWRFGRSSALIVGAVLIGWVGVEILIIGYHPQPPLQLIYGSVGLLILVLALLPSVKRPSKIDIEMEYTIAFLTAAVGGRLGFEEVFYRLQELGIYVSVQGKMVVSMSFEPD